VLLRERVILGASGTTLCSFAWRRAGVVTILVTFTVDRAAHHYWTFYGVLLPLGEGLFCAVEGAQIWRTSEQVVRPDACTIGPRTTEHHQALTHSTKT
jgi:hypothetical protein